MKGDIMSDDVNRDVGFEFVVTKLSGGCLVQLHNGDSTKVFVTENPYTVVLELCRLLDIDLVKKKDDDTMNGGL